MHPRRPEENIARLQYHDGVIGDERGGGGLNQRMKPELVCDSGGSHVERIKEELRRRIEVKTRELEELQAAVNVRRAYVRALEEAYQLFGETTGDVGSGGIDVLRVERMLRTEARPLHINEILDRLGIRRSKNNRQRLRSAVSQHANPRGVFTRIGSDYFGLPEARPSWQWDDGSEKLELSGRDFAKGISDDDIPF